MTSVHRPTQLPTLTGQEVSDSLNSVGLWCKSLVCLNGAVVCLHAVMQVQLFVTVGNGLKYNAQ